MTSREELEQQKAYHYECIRALNIRLNALAPISRLPSELLTGIFLHAAGHRDGPASLLPDLRHWIRVTHVCTHWRETALQCTELWSHIDVPALRGFLSEFLVRSQSRPLTMTLSFSQLRRPGKGEREHLEDILLQALSALHRVRDLTVDVSVGPTDAILQRMGSHAPLLESLRIAGCLRSVDSARVRAFFSRMLQHQSRRLRTLETNACHLNWQSVPFDGLKRLKVHGNWILTKSDLTSFLHALASMSQLEELYMEQGFIEHGHATVIPTLPTQITLPRLRYLLVRYETTSMAAALLDNLYTPSLARLSVDVRVFNGLRKEDHVLLLASMARKVVTLGQFMTVAFSLFTLREARIRLYRDVCERTADPKDDSTSEWLAQHVPAFEYHGRTDVDYMPLAEFCNLVHVGDAQTLILSSTFPVAQGDWLNITRHMEGVTELRLHGTMSNVVNSLSQNHEDSGTGRNSFLLPNLRVFTMDGMDFRETQRNREEHRAHGTGVVSELRAGLVRRAQEGAEIETLRIIYAKQLGEEDLARLREVVRCVESDGRLNCRESHVMVDGRQAIIVDNNDSDFDGWSDGDDADGDSWPSDDSDRHWWDHEDHEVYDDDGLYY